jgi:hypothetical protein
VTETRHFCDRCHERITQDRTLYQLRCGGLLRHKRPELELCGSCAEALDVFVATFHDGLSAPRPKRENGSSPPTHTRSEV